MLIKLLIALCTTASTLALSAKILSGSGFNATSYEGLLKELTKIPSTGTICFGHGVEGAQSIVKDSNSCSKVVLYGVAPSFADLTKISKPTLILGGTLDGVTSMFQFAASRHRGLSDSCRFVLIKGASHSSIAEGALSSFVAKYDLLASLSKAEVLSTVVKLVTDFVGSSDGFALSAEEKSTALLVSPIVAALELEGSAALGNPSCNSDFPTNPTCNYPIYPGESLIPGPAPAPNPLPPSTCVCGSNWVMGLASVMNADFAESKRPSTTLIAADSFHDVSDTHPFHLPNIFNECSKDLTQSCALNITTVTEPLLKAGDLFASTATVYSAFELRTKFKSRQAIWQKAALGSGTDALDQGTNNCKKINQKAYEWALANAEASVKKTFDAYGEPYVMVDDKEAPIGLTGPTWIEKEMIYKRVTAAGKSHIEVQSWSFVVANTFDGNLPWYTPVGMHYCKLLSPARAMEWIYTEGVRARLALGPQ